MLAEVTKFLDVISPLLLLGFYLVKVSINLRRDYVFWFVLFQSLINTIAVIYDKILLWNNLFLYHINCAVSFIILSFYYYATVSTIRVQFLIFTNLILFTIFFTLNVIFWEDLNSFNSNSLSVASLLIVVYSFLYYLEQLLRPATIEIVKLKDFWFVTGFFTYYASSFFIFLTYKKLTQINIQDLGILWQTHNVLYLLLCIYLFRGLLCGPLREKFSL